jgi:hypothetical protein
MIVLPRIFVPRSAVALQRQRRIVGSYAGLGYVLPQIAADLSSKGLFTLAAALESKLRQSGPGYRAAPDNDLALDRIHIRHHRARSADRAFLWILGRNGHAIVVRRDPLVWFNCKDSGTMFSPGEVSR